MTTLSFNLLQLLLYRDGGAVTAVLRPRVVSVPCPEGGLQARPAPGGVQTRELGRHPLPDRREGRPGRGLHGALPLPGLRGVQVTC